MKKVAVLGIADWMILATVRHSGCLALTFTNVSAVTMAIQNGLKLSATILYELEPARVRESQRVLLKGNYAGEIITVFPEDSDFEHVRTSLRNATW